MRTNYKRRAVKLALPDPAVLRHWYEALRTASFTRSATHKLYAVTHEQAKHFRHRLYVARAIDRDIFQYEYVEEPYAPMRLSVLLVPTDGRYEVQFLLDALTVFDEQVIDVDAAWQKSQYAISKINAANIFAEAQRRRQMKFITYEDIAASIVPPGVHYTRTAAPIEGADVVAALKINTPEVEEAENAALREAEAAKPKLPPVKLFSWEELFKHPQFISVLTGWLENVNGYSVESCLWETGKTIAKLLYERGIPEKRGVPAELPTDIQALIAGKLEERKLAKKLSR